MKSTVVPNLCPRDAETVVAPRTAGPPPAVRSSPRPAPRRPPAGPPGGNTRYRATPWRTAPARTPRRVTCSRITMRHTDITPLSWETRHFAPTAAAKRQLYRRSAVCRSHEQREKFSNAYQSCDTSKIR